MAYDGKRMTRNCITMLAANPALTDLPVHVVMSGKQNSEADKHLEWASHTSLKAVLRSKRLICRVILSNKSPRP